ncbi:MAG: UDP-N-acetylmuramoyl-L-alanine--D-glutamate ligase [Armatimonadetes bacterium]|nr:UDP-N-acetylmuramoyl-L-alanine--D-glutamate ligase [Armatimonadota bacterium]MDE2205217.1 UDP-N-acetylmuramoyl-L-alanine--D-glutamate ligase [Armatimonadota bacterium]
MNSGHAMLEIPRGSQREWDGLRVAILGAGRSGTAVAEALARLGAAVNLYDDASESALDAERIAAVRAAGGGIEAPAGIHDNAMADCDLLVVSPGVSVQHRLMQAALRLGIPIWSEVEVAWRLTRARILAVTGTNGKTTVATLAHRMLCSAGFDAALAGNISADAVKQTFTEASRHFTEPQAIIVLELSSFQLENCHTFAPDVAVATNITSDHLDRYATRGAYVAAKARLFARQSSTDAAVLNRDDAGCLEVFGGVPAAQVLWFTRECRLPAAAVGAWVEADRIAARLKPHGQEVFLAELPLPQALEGAHQQENVMAAALAAMSMGATPEAISAALAEFTPVPHRMEPVAFFRGVRYINNSMCTNVDAAIASIRTAHALGPVVAIMGGAAKGESYTELGPSVVPLLKAAITIGQTGPAMAASLRAAGLEAVSAAESLRQAVLDAARLARAGDVVILCPAAASFDMFSNFEDRGTQFRQLANTIAAGEA